MEALTEVVLNNPTIVYYGPHPCDLCEQKNIVRGSAEQGFGDIRLEYPEGEIIYPNHQWKEHICSAGKRALPAQPSPEGGSKS